MEPMRRSLLPLALLLASTASAQEHHHHMAMGATAPPVARTYKIPDLPVETQEGQPVHFYRDLVQGRVVVMNFIFTSCTTICPTMGATFARVQTLLGPRAANVALISVSIDPAHDTPARLTEWARRLGAKPGWTLVTGRKTDLDQILKALGLFTADPAAHSPVVLVGNDAAGSWERVDGLATPSAIMEAVDRLSTKEP
jgi:protein SCO1/2